MNSDLEQRLTMPGLLFFLFCYSMYRRRVIPLSPALPVLTLVCDVGHL